MLRGGAFKPRTSPFAFKGLGAPGSRSSPRRARRPGCRSSPSCSTPRIVELVAAHADVIQIGARNMQNYALLEVAGKLGKPVLLKRGLSSSLDELLMAADYVLKEGNERVILCERGIRTFETATRFTLDLSAVPWLKLHSHLPVIVDPSHASGDRRLVEPLSRAAAAVGRGRDHRGGPRRSRQRAVRRAAGALRARLQGLRRSCRGARRARRPGAGLAGAGRFVVRLLFVCMGNICRSPTAEGVMRGLLREQGLEGAVEVDSAGTGEWHVGAPPDTRAAAAARLRGVTLEGAARAVAPADFDAFDLLLATDRRNLCDLQAVAPPGARRASCACCGSSTRPRRARATSTSPTPTTARPTASSTCSTSSRPPAAACSTTLRADGRL